MSGFWSLWVLDDFGGDVGTLVDWSIEFRTTVFESSIVDVDHDTRVTATDAIGAADAIHVEVNGTEHLVLRENGLEDLQFSFNNTDPSYNLLIGENSGNNLSHSIFSEGWYNTGIGHLTLSNTTVGFGNTAIGYKALHSNVDGNGNIGIGYIALRDNTSGFSNVAIGGMEKNLDGDDNVAVGSQALNSSTSGNNNVAVGRLAGGQNVSGSGNIFLGSNAGQGELGSNKLYIHNSA
jgi:hypothetical protein